MEGFVLFHYLLYNIILQAIYIGMIKFLYITPIEEKLFLILYNKLI